MLAKYAKKVHIVYRQKINAKVVQMKLFAMEELIWYQRKDFEGKVIRRMYFTSANSTKHAWEESVLIIQLEIVKMDMKEIFVTIVLMDIIEVYLIHAKNVQKNG